jgi:peptidyl-prolyl cis-trans isomerase B (cyclophilin B)
MKKVICSISVVICVVFLVFMTGCESEEKAGIKKTSGSDKKSTGHVNDKTDSGSAIKKTTEPKTETGSTAKKDLIYWKEQVKTLTVEQMQQATAVIETNQGTIKLKFFPDKAPGHVRNFIQLAQSGFYDGLIFHRVIQNFMIQGGCPEGTGRGNPGYSVKAEFNDTVHKPGILSMARSKNPDSAGSQFFICQGRPSSNLDGQYTAFGKVIEGMDVVDKIGTTQTGMQNRPVQEQVMKRVYIEGL